MESKIRNDFKIWILHIITLFCLIVFYSVFKTRPLPAVIGFLVFFIGLIFVQRFVMTLDPVNVDPVNETDESSSKSDEVSQDQSEK